MKQETLFLILGFHGYVYAQSIRSIAVNNSPFCITDINGNCQGFSNQKQVAWDTSNTNGKPSSLALENAQTNDLLTIQIDNPPKGTFYGTLNGVNVTLPVKIRGGSTTVTTGLAGNFADNSVPWSLSGGIKWFVDGTPLRTTTPVKLYAISQSAPDYFKKYGMYDDFLSFVLPQNDGKSRLPQDTASYNQFVGRRIHKDTKFKYDIFRGAPRYYTNNQRMTTNDNQNQINGWFALRAWLNDRKLIGTSGINGEVNCYDQAGLIQMALSLGRTPVDQINLAYSSPYGYITRTTLVGGYDTNSPFFKNNPAVQVMPAKDSKRTSFGNHMFCAVGPVPSDIINMSANQKSALRIFDSCAGPAVGTQTLPQYLNAAVDTNNYRNQGRPTMDQVKIGRGVTQFNNNLRNGAFTRDSKRKRQETTQTQSSFDDVDEQGFADRLKAIGCNSGKDSGKVYRLDFNHVDNTLGGDNQQHSVLSKETFMNVDSSVFSYIYRMNGDAKEDVRIRMTVAKDHQAAFLALNHTLTQYDSKLEDIFQAPPKDKKGTLGSWTLYGKNSCGKGGIMYVEGNVMVDISGCNESAKLESTAQDIYKFITSPPAAAKNPPPCEVGQVKLPESHDSEGENTIQVGQTVKMTLNVKNSYQADYTLQNGNALVTYMSQNEAKDGYDVEILGCEQGDDEIVFSFLSPAGEVRESQPMKIKVVPAQGGNGSQTDVPAQTAQQTEAAQQTDAPAPTYGTATGYAPAQPTDEPAQPSYASPEETDAPEPTQQQTGYPQQTDAPEQTDAPGTDAPGPEQTEAPEPTQQQTGYAQETETAQVPEQTGDSQSSAGDYPSQETAYPAQPSYNAGYPNQY